MDIPQGINVAAVISLVGLCMRLAKTNGAYVKRQDCHDAQNGIGKRIDDLRSHLDTRIDDLKDAIKNRK